MCVLCVGLVESDMNVTTAATVSVALFLTHTKCAGVFIIKDEPEEYKSTWVGGQLVRALITIL